MKKTALLVFLVLFLGFAAATAPTLNSASDSPDPVAAEAVITFTTTAGTSVDGFNFKLRACKTGSDVACDAWCVSDFNTTATSAQCSYTTGIGESGEKSYNAIICDDTSQCSSPQAGTFTITAAADITAPAAAVKDVNGDTSAPYWATTDQAVKLTINIGEASGECKWSDTNWGATAYADAGTACTTSGNDSTCELGAKAQTTSAGNTVYFNCKDSAGNATGGIAASYGVDYTKPVPSISSISVSGTSVTVNYTASDPNSGIAKYEVSINSGSFVDRGTATSHEFTGVSNGDHNFTVRATDNAGNFASVSEIRTVNSNSSAVGSIPDLNSATHRQDVWVSNSSPQFTWGTASNATKYRYMLDTNSGTVPDSSNETTDRSKSYTGISDGERYFHVRACNAANDCGATSHYRIRIDTTAPGPVSDISGFSQSNGSIYISWGEPDDESGIREYTIYRNIFGKVGSRDFVPSDPGIKKFTGITNEFYTDNNGLAKDQVYYYRIQSVDNALNQGSMSGVVQIQNSGSSCTLDITSNMPQYVGAGNIDLKITIGGGNISNATLRLKLPGQDVQKTLENQGGALIQKTIAIPDGISGTGYIEIEGRAPNGAACKKQIEFTVDSQNPTISIIAPEAGIALGGPVKILASAGDSGSGIESVKATVDGKDIGNLTLSGSNYELAWNSGSVSAGTHTLVITATDKAGNSASSQQEILALGGGGNVFLRKEFSYDASSIEDLLKGAGVRDEFIAPATKLISENGPKRTLLITKSGAEFSVQILLSVRNTGSGKVLSLIEVIPKDVIGNARDIESENDFSIIQGDPIIKFNLGEIGTGETAGVSYIVGSGLSQEEANKIADGFDSFTAPPIILEGEAADAIESTQTSDWIFWVFIAAVGLIVMLIIIVVLGGGAFLLHRHLKGDAGMATIRESPKRNVAPKRISSFAKRSEPEPKSSGKFSFKK